MSDALPQGLIHYATSPRFTQDTVPAKLQQDHSTKAGTWGRIVVHEGALTYHRPDSTVTLGAGDTAVIYPKELHSVAVEGDVAFEVEFHREGAA